METTTPPTDTPISDQMPTTDFMAVNREFHGQPIFCNRAFAIRKPHFSESAASEELQQAVRPDLCTYRELGCLRFRSHELVSRYAEREIGHERSRTNMRN